MLGILEQCGAACQALLTSLRLTAALIQVALLELIPATQVAHALNLLR
jgi:hypothetical protein